jgi:peptidoglycan/xylan/chitin deacetylase (PgdA/CDA1 family)
VTLSYDDGLDGQLQNAVPALDARGLKATFFLASFQGVEHNWSLPDPTSELTARHQAWQQVASSGHELGGHTIYHPCDNNNPGFQPQDYDQLRMAEELDESILRLARLGAAAR